jgi:MYXO-CTERM domain-containing protein
MGIFGGRRIASLGAGFALLLAATSARAATFTKGPYLQALGPAGVTIKLELDAALPVSIAVTDGATHKTLTFDDGEAKAFHAVRVSGLAGSTAYDYVATSADLKSEVGHFTTAPTEDRPFRFILYGDSRTDDVSHQAIVHQLLERRSDFLIGTGDVVYRGADSKEWDRFFAIEGPLLRDRCAFMVVGNHELVGGKDGEVAYLKYFAPDEFDPKEDRRLYGSFRWGNTRFFMLNAMDEWGGVEKNWLTETASASLTEAGVMHRIAVLHHGPFSSGPHRGNPRLGSVLSILRDNKIELILAGHDHIYERGEGAGIKYLISGGAGAPLYPREHQAPETIAFESVHHYVELSVDKDRIAIVARRAAGSIIEACSFKSGKPWSCEGSTPPTFDSVSRPDPAKAEKPKAKGGCGCDVAGERSASGSAWVALMLTASLARRRSRRRLAERG